MEKLPTLLITRDLFIDILKAFKEDNKRFEKITKAFGHLIDGEFHLNTSVSHILEKIICDAFGNHGDAFSDVINGAVYVNLPKKSGDLYDYFMVGNFADNEVSPEFIYELSLHHQYFKKHGSVIASFPRILNYREILIAQFIGFNHEIHNNKVITMVDSSVVYKRFSVINNSID